MCGCGGVGVCGGGGGCLTSRRLHARYISSCSQYVESYEGGGRGAAGVLSWGCRLLAAVRSVDMGTTMKFATQHNTLVRCNGA